MIRRLYQFLSAVILTYHTGKERQKQKFFLDNICYFEIKGRQIDVHEINGIFTYYEKISILDNIVITCLNYIVYIGIIALGVLQML